LAAVKDFEKSPFLVFAISGMEIGEKFWEIKKFQNSEKNTEPHPRKLTYLGINSQNLRGQICPLYR
jgi:hypothetical protein